MKKENPSVSLMFQAISALRNSPAKVFLDAAAAGDAQTIEYILRHDPHLSPEENHDVLTRPPSISIQPKHITRALKDAIRGEFYNVTSVLIDKGARYLNSDQIAQTASALISYISENGQDPDAITTLEKLSSFFQDEDKAAFTTALQTFLRADDLSMTAEEFWAQVGWNKAKAAYFERTPAELQKCAQGNDAHLKAREGAIAVKRNKHGSTIRVISRTS